MRQQRLQRRRRPHRPRRRAPQQRQHRQRRQHREVLEQQDAEGGAPVLGRRARFRSPSSCSTMGVDERLSPKPATSAAGSGRPSSSAERRRARPWSPAPARRRGRTPPGAAPAAGCGCSSRPITKSSSTTPNSAKCRMLSTSRDEPEAEGADEHAAGEVGQHRAEPEAPEQRHGDHRRRQQDRQLAQVFHDSPYGAFPCAGRVRG